MLECPYCKCKLVFLEIDEKTGYKVYKCVENCKKEWIDEPIDVKIPKSELQGRDIVCKGEK